MSDRSPIQSVPKKNKHIKICEQDSIIECQSTDSLVGPTATKPQSSQLISSTQDYTMVDSMDFAAEQLKAAQKKRRRQQQKRVTQSTVSNPREKYDCSAVDQIMSDFKNTMRQFDMSQKKFQREKAHLENNFFKKIFLMKQPEDQDTDLKKLNEIQIEIMQELGRDHRRSKTQLSQSLGRPLSPGLDFDETQSDRDFLEFLKQRLNQADAYQVSKGGFKYSSQERQEALIFKTQLKKMGRLQERDKLGQSLGKIAFKSIQLDKEGDELIKRFIVSFDLLANVKYSPDLEAYLPQNEFVSDAQSAPSAPSATSQSIPKITEASVQRLQQNMVIEEDATLPNLGHLELSEKSSDSSRGGIVSASHQVQALSSGVATQKPPSPSRAQSHFAKARRFLNASFVLRQSSKKIVPELLSHGKLLKPSRNDEGQRSRRSSVGSQASHRSSKRAKRRMSRMPSRPGKEERVSEPPLTQAELQNQAYAKQLSELTEENLTDLLSGKKSLETIQIEKLKQDQWVDLLISSDLSFCQYKTFERAVRFPEVLNKVSLNLIKVHGGVNCPFTRNQIDKALTMIDKDLYVKFRDGQLTFDQLKARTAEKQGLAKYVVLDDIRGQLHPLVLENKEQNAHLYDMITQEVGKTRKEKSEFLAKMHGSLENWEVNPKCVRSLLFKPRQEERASPTETPFLDLPEQESQATSKPKVESGRGDPHSQLKKLDLPSRSKPLTIEEEFNLVRQAGESTKQFEDRIRHKRMGKHFMRYLKRHQNLVKTQVSFYCTKNEAHMEKDKQDLLERRQARQKESQAYRGLKQQTQESPERPKTAEETRKPEEPPTEEEIRAFAEERRKRPRANFLKTSGPLNMTQILEKIKESKKQKSTSRVMHEGEQEEGRLSGRLNVNYLNFAKPYEYRNLQSMEITQLKERESKHLNVFQEEKVVHDRMVDLMGHEIETMYAKVDQANDETCFSSPESVISEKKRVKKPLAYQKRLPEDQLKRNQRKRLFELAKNQKRNEHHGERTSALQDAAKKYEVLQQAMKPKISEGPAILDLEVQKQLKLDAELAWTRELMFMKRLKDDGKDVVINQAHKNNLQIEDNILKAIVEDVTTPRSNLRSIKQRQALIEALTLKITSGADETTASTTVIKTNTRESSRERTLDEDTSSALKDLVNQGENEVDYELQNPNIKRHQIKDMQLSTNLKAMELQSQIRFEDFRNRLKNIQTKRLSAQKRRTDRRNVGKQRAQSVQPSKGDPSVASNPKLLSTRRHAQRLLEQKSRAVKGSLGPSVLRSALKLSMDGPPNLSKQSRNPGRKGSMMTFKRQTQSIFRNAMVASPQSETRQVYSPQSFRAMLSPPQTKGVPYQGPNVFLGQLGSSFGNAGTPKESYKLPGSKSALSTKALEVINNLSSNNMGSGPLSQKRSQTKLGFGESGGIDQIRSASSTTLRGGGTKQNHLLHSSLPSSMTHYSGKQLPLGSRAGETVLRQRTDESEVGPSRPQNTRVIAVQESEAASRNKQKMYLTEVFQQRQVFEKMRSMLNREEEELIAQRKHLLSSEAVTKGQDLRLRFLKSRSSRANTSFK